MTVNAGTSSITTAGFSGQFNGGGFTYNTVNVTGANQAIRGVNTFTNLTATGGAAIDRVLTLDANQTVTGTLTINGNSTVNRLLVQSNTLGTQRTITTTGATVGGQYADFVDIAMTATTDLTGFTGGAGDCGGNSGMTFTTPATQTWSGTSGGNWSANAWTSRIPLPQDDVVISSAFSASQTITINVKRMGKSIDFTGTTGNPVLAFGSTSRDIFGSLTLVSGMTTTGTVEAIFQGRSSYTLTTAGISLTCALRIQAPGGTLTLGDALTSSAAITHTHGTFDTNDNNLTVTTFSSNATTTRAIDLGSSTITLTSTGSVWNCANTGGLTFTAGTSTIKMTDSSATAKTFAGGGLTYNNVWNAPGAGTATLNISGANTMADLNDDGSAAHSVLFTANLTHTFGSWTGFAGNLVTIGSITAANHTLAKSGGGVVNVALAAVSRSTATPGSTWYASAAANDNGNNSGWSFSSAGISGTLSATLGALTGTGGGDLTVSGAVTSTLGSLTVSAASAIAIHATAGITLGGATLSAAGTVALTAAASQTLASAVLSSQAAVANSGAVAATLGAVQSGGSAAIDITGGVSATLAAVTVVATGGSSGMGTVAATLGALSGSASAVLDIAATSGISLGALTTGAAGTIDLSGAATITLGSLSGTGAGAVSISGGLASTLELMTVDATGREVISLPVPADRTAVVPAEDRTVIVAAEQRTVVVPAEARQASVGAETRLARAA
jgi:fibronectin-binding autotransporter adhesin